MTKDKKTKPGIYILTLTSGRSHEQIWAIPFKARQAVVVGVSAIVLLLAIVFAIIAFTPLKSFIPGYPDSSSRREAVQNAVRIDSLEREILQWQLYTENLRRVVAGEEPLKLDSLILERNASATEDATYDPALDSLLKSRINALDYEEEDDGTEVKTDK